MTALSFQPGDVVRIRDERWTVAQSVASGATLLEVRGCDRANHGTRAHFLLPFEPIERLPLSRTPRVVRPTEWRLLTRRALATATPSYEALRIVAGHALSIFPFQLEPAIAIARGLASRVLIADEVGLGKTVQAGLVVGELLERRPDAHILVVTPAGLREQWHTELLTRIGVHAIVLDAASIALSGAGANPWAVHPVIVTSIDYVKRPEVMRALEALIWDVVVFDEAHTLAGRSDRHAAAQSLARRARHLVMTTATPHSGDDVGFERLCELGNLRGQSPLIVFRRTRRDVGLATSRRTVWLRVRPTSDELAMHHALMAYTHLVWNQNSSSNAARLAMSVLARRACSSAASLARSVERRLTLLAGHEAVETLQMTLPFDNVADDEEPVAALGAQGLSDGNEERGRLEALLALAHRAARAESKVSALVRLLRRARQPAIVFTEYRDTLAMLAAALDAWTPSQIHGGLGPSERGDVLHGFTHEDASLLLATDAASEGLNLQHRCRLVINLELPWMPHRLEQRVGRVDRLGQPRRVHAVHLLAAGTTEERTVATLVRRIRSASGALENLTRTPVDEDHVARCVIESDAAIEPPPSRPPLPKGIGTVDLRDIASAEARRITTTRSLADDRDALPGGRAWATRMRSRTHASNGLAAFRLTFTDAEQHLVWDTLVALTHRVARAPRGRRQVRAWIEQTVPLVSVLIDEEHRAALARLRVALRPLLTRAAAREQAIVEHLTKERARIAATLGQRHLFDRRNERAADAQTAILDEALSRCQVRLADLARYERIVAHDHPLVFAVILH